MKIYTKKGDSGTTQLLGGKRVSKSHLRIEAYGTVDELNAYMGLLRDQEIDQKSIEMFLIIQDRLFTIGSLLALENPDSKIKLPKLSESDVSVLENQMDQMNEQLDEMKSFVLPGGHTIVSYCHIARCICRRAERVTTLLPQETVQFELILKYLNRLSDYLFVMSRFLTKLTNSKEIPWQPKI